MYNQEQMIRSTFFDLNIDEIDYYPFIISMNMCDGNCNITQDLFGRISIPNKMKKVKLKVFNMVKRLDGSKTLVKHICLYVNVIVGNVSLDSVDVKKQ